MGGQSQHRPIAALNTGLLLNTELPNNSYLKEHRALKQYRTIGARLNTGLPGAIGTANQNRSINCLHDHQALRVFPQGRNWAAGLSTTIMDTVVLIIVIVHWLIHSPQTICLYCKTDFF